MVIEELQQNIDKHSGRLKRSNISLLTQEIFSYFYPDIIDIFLKDNIDGVEIHEESDFIDIKIRKIKG